MIFRYGKCSCGKPKISRAKKCRACYCGKNIKERFFKYVSKEKKCWRWIGAIHPDGYGKFLLHGINTNAHRVSWIIHKSKIPKGMCVCHTCDNPPCVNPRHLWLGTHADNMKDMVGKGRQVSRKGEKCHFSKFDESQVSDIRSLYKLPEFRSSLKLSKIYDVSHRAILLIVNRKSWKHIKP